jgi:hypothetical protein
MCQQRRSVDEALLHEGLILCKDLPADPGVIIAALVHGDEQWPSGCSGFVHGGVLAVVRFPAKGSVCTMQ